MLINVDHVKLITNHKNKSREKYAKIRSEQSKKQKRVNFLRKKFSTEITYHVDIQDIQKILEEKFGTKISYESMRIIIDECIEQGIIRKTNDIRGNLKKNIFISNLP